MARRTVIRLVKNAQALLLENAALAAQIKREVEPEVRHHKVAEMQAKVEAGTADLNFKLDIAVDRLLDVLFPNDQRKAA